jgi:hypothetical protein
MKSVSSVRWRLFCLGSVLALGTAAVAWAAGGTGDSKPDFTGVWGTYSANGARGAGGPPPVRTPPDFPFTPEGQRLHDEYLKLQGPQRDGPAAYCTDYGMPTMMETAGGYPLEFIQKPDQVSIIYEVEDEMRRVFLNGKGIPKEKRLPTRDGYSVGHWEGNTLVVETTDLTNAQDQMHPHSDQATILERFSLETDKAGRKVMSYTATLTDPVYYTRPVTFERKWTPTPEGYIVPYRCTDEFWDALLDLRREELKAGKPVTAKMSDVYKAREANY